jgi:hypothetical protein
MVAAPDFIQDYIDGIREVSHRQSELEHRQRDFRSYEPRNNGRMAELRDRYDSAYSSLGTRGAPQPIAGESEYSYRRRLASGLQSCSPQWKSADLWNLGADALSAIEPILLQDTTSYVADRTRPNDDGTLRAIHTRSDAGHPMTTWAGSPLSWMSQFMGPRFMLRSMKNPKTGEQYRIQRRTV